ncbi:solid-state culture expressed protein (Aos23), putative [Talaromyces stipitatus ATCC 10500]|uniref:Solid-state culture expressed protein (Aos23), putative n=1 Tax=Talaromyces stipitatus (strain ATCC 10500 / CBS 375.48 / QM 6759 / NRRL 1006) TaxID=441959 RepID=B8M333_TALSN|nr:solid-state culture expressed protein (Aos23), putative [Talaromyces stipitatus ATCC 10500]EED22009.1 solid-state culture expressed protein (Aos23), putative [Talaromyces stipitatus ATCC 10500]
METVNKVVDAGYKAIWGEQNTNEQTTASNSQPTTSTGVTGIQSVDKVVEAGKKAIWGESTTDSQQQTSTSHGEEPVAGKRGLGTATDPYDAGNRDEQYDAPPVEAGGLPTSIPTSEQRNIETTDTSLNTPNMGSSSGTAVAGTEAAKDLKPSATGLRPDPAQPGNAADFTSRAVPDGGPGQTLKHTSKPFEEESQKLAKDLQNINVNDDKPKVHTVTGGVAVSRPNQAVHPKEDKEDSHSSSSDFSSGVVDNRGQDKTQGQGQSPKSKTSKLEKVKSKLHLGNHSPKASK